MPIQPNGMLVAEGYHQSEEIPDQVIAAIHSLEQETSISTELGHVEDIIKDLMELDDDLLDSLAAQICADFDILKYTGSELDAWSNNDEINLPYISNVPVEEPQVIQETPSEFRTKLASSEPFQQNETKAAIQMMEAIAQNNVSYLDQRSEFIPHLNISQPLDSHETNEASYQTSTNQTRQVQEKKYEELTGSTEAYNQKQNDEECYEEHNRMTGEELCVGQGVDENTTHFSQLHKQRKLTTKITNRLHKPKKFLNSIKTGRREHKCKLCTATFRRKCDLVSHLLTFTHKKTQMEHKSMIHTSSQANKKNDKTKNTKSYECEHCKKTFRRKSNFLAHAKIHSDERPFECVVCKKSFRREDYLLCHSRVHSDERPFECVVCKKTFRWTQCLRQHSRIHLGKTKINKSYECEHCKKTFRWKSTLLVHTQIHSDERPFECVVCKKSFRQENGLLNHSRVHSDERPFECVVCKKIFRWKTTLRQHSRIHLDEKPYECVVCKKSFRREDSLLNHSRVHSDERPFECVVCKKSFRWRQCLRQHSRIHLDENRTSATFVRNRFV